MTTQQTLKLATGKTLAYRKITGDSPGVIFLCGFRSNMRGIKASALADYCQEKKLSYLCFDYLGHGDSSGEFTQCQIGTWINNAIEVFDNLSSGPQIIIGSSMGAWIMLKLAQQRPERIKGLIGIASAVDFTELLIWNKLDQNTKEKLIQQGHIVLPSQYDELGYPITLKLINEARNHFILNQKLVLNCPIRLLHGTADKDVPWEMSQRLLEHITATNIELTLCKNADHRFSKTDNITLLCNSLQQLISLTT